MIEFFFDCSSPWTYLAFHNIQPLAKEFGAEIVWRPILVGGIFNTINPSVYAQREHPVEAKVAYQKKDMADWARSAGLAIKMRPTVFPVNSVKAMRGCIWLARDGKDMVQFARAVFEAYWGADQDISKDEVLTEICKRVGIDPQKFLAGIGEQAIKDQLKDNTDEVMARGGFGSPTIFVGQSLGPDKMVPFARAVFEIYWGEDQDISQDAVLTEVCRRTGVDAQAFFAGIGQQAIKDQLKANTDEVMARGGFGSPTIFLDKTDMYFGNDRLPLLREALARRKERAA